MVSSIDSIQKSVQILLESRKQGESYQKIWNTRETESDQVDK